MARATTITRLPLDTWARIMGIDPFHFNQVQLPSTIREQRTCDGVWTQHPWQDAGQVSREDVAIAIKQAEDLIERYLGYTVLPVWQVDERHVFQSPGDPSVLNVGFQDGRGFARSVQGDWGQLVSGGIESKTVIEAGAAVVYSDQDGDGYDETATVSVATTVTDPDEIRVYYPGQGGRDEWEIKPLDDPLTRRRSVTISGGTATITFWKHQAVDQDLLEAIVASAVDGGQNTNFLATVDVYQVVNDPQQQATLMWNPRLTFCDCATGSCPACAHSTQSACMVASDYRTSRARVNPATWNATTEQFDAAQLALSRSPNLVRMWYYAGYRDMRKDAPSLEIDDEMARAITYLSLQFMMREFCGCENVTHFAAAMTQDLALELSTEPKTTSFQINDSIIQIPWGTTRGAVLAWRTLNQQEGAKAKVGRAVRL